LLPLLLNVTLGRHASRRREGEDFPIACTHAECVNTSLCAVTVPGEEDPQPSHVARSRRRGTNRDLSSERSKFDDGLRAGTGGRGCASSSRRSIASFGRLAEAEGFSTITLIVTRQAWSAMGAQARLVGLHARARCMQHRLEGRTERGRSVLDRGGRSTLGPVCPRAETAKFPAGPPTAGESSGLACWPFVARRAGGATRVVWFTPSGQSAPRAISQLEIRGQAPLLRAETAPAWAVPRMRQLSAS
jgi:hypothetical protein